MIARTSGDAASPDLLMSITSRVEFTRVAIEQAAYGASQRN